MRIKVTGYIESDDLPFEFVDSEHEMGLSGQGYERMASYGTFHGPGMVTPVGIEDVEFEREEG